MRDAVELVVRAAVHLAGELRRRVEVRREERAACPRRGRRPPARCRRPRSCSRRRSAGSPPRGRPRGSSACRATLTRSARTGSATTSLTSAIAARWMIASQPRTARRVASRSARSPIDRLDRAGPWCGDGTRSKMTGSWPCARSRSTTCEPMKPAPPVTRTLISDDAPGARHGRGPVVERRAPVVLRHPVGVREVDVVAHDRWQGSS